MRTLLIDGDTIAFKAAAASQEIIDWDGNHQPYASEPVGRTIVDNLLGQLKVSLKADKVMVFLSCPAEENWRLSVYPDYKANRSRSVRPLLLEPLKRFLRADYQAIHHQFIEADDALGIYATHPDLVPGEKIVVGRDKDFKTIPGLHHQLGDHGPDKEPIVREVTPMAALLAHMGQALTGDAVDGFPGCPGFGPVRAQEVLDNPTRLIPERGMVTRGPRKGEETVKWTNGGPCSPWEAVVCRYEKAGLTEADALRTARLAKILLHEDYDLETHEVRLWAPPEV